jgi:hypothetical protein
LVGIVALSRNNSRHHSPARSKHWCAGGIYRLSILVSADVSQPIQKIIGIGWIMSADTINHIFCIGCTMSADTNNVSGIRGVPRRCETIIMVKFGFAPSACPIFPPSMPPPPSTLPPLMPRHRHRCHHRQPHLRPRHRAVANPVPDPAFGLDATGSVPVIEPDPVAPSLRRSVMS